MLAIATVWIIGFSFANAQTTVESLRTTICDTIKLAARNGSSISWVDYSHCHVLAPDNQPAPNQRTLAVTAQRYRALLCHAHEFDGKRTFSEGRDNTNIIVSRPQGTPVYAGILETVSPAMLSSRGMVASGLSSRWDINFFELGDPFCSEFKNPPETLACNGKQYCLGTDLKDDMDSLLRRAAVTTAAMNANSTAGSPVSPTAPTPLPGATEQSNSCSAIAVRSKKNYTGCQVTRGNAPPQVLTGITELGCTSYCESLRSIGTDDLPTTNR